MTHRLKIFLHGRCFDGASSAALFSRFYSERIDARADVVFAGKSHGRGPIYEDVEFDADDHAAVDFRYCRNSRMGWWFDHHVSAFSADDDEANFRARPSERFFYDPHARSCTKFLAESLAQRYGWDFSRYRELVYWADLIDGAQYENAAQATAMAEPAMKLALFIEHNIDPVLERRFIEALTTQSLPDLAAERFIRDALTPVLALRERAAVAIRARLDSQHGVAFFDVGDEDLDGYDRFLPYALAPEAHYLVAVSASDSRTKVAVGSNPWNRPPKLVHLARLCERYGGGGHEVVGAVTLPAGALDEARQIAAEITEELRREPSRPK